MNDTTSLKAFFGFQQHPFPPACAPEPLFRSEVLDAALRQTQNYNGLGFSDRCLSLIRR